MKETIKRLIVFGRVQGVGYRAFVEDEALHRGLEGFVRNRRDGTVEAVIAGPGEEVDLMIAACREGPFAARVERVTETTLGGEAGEEALAQRRPGERFSVLATR